MEKKERIWCRPMIKTPTLTKYSKTHHDNSKTPRKTSIAQRLQTDLEQSVGTTTATPTGMVKPVHGILTFSVTAKAV